MTSTADSKSVLIIAAEASSALYAQRLMESWSQSGQNIKSFGVGNADMVNLGFEAIGRSESMAVVGIQEVIAHWSEIKTVFNKVLSEVDKRKPKFALLLDYPGFNLRLAKKLKERGVKVIYYISPQIWAWKKGRIKTMRKHVDLVLTIFPFENKFYDDHNVPCKFVGHPLLDEVANFSVGNRAEIRQKYGVESDQFVLGLMPGSRKSEINHHLQTQIDVARELRKRNEKLKIALLVAPGLDAEKIKQSVGDLPFPMSVVQSEPFNMIGLCDIVLCASGTATIMVGLMEKPMVVMYKMNALTAFLAKILVGKKSFFAMANLILGREVVPERFQENANVKELSRLLEKYIKDEEHREKVSLELAEIKTKLGDRGATERVAQALAPYL